MTRRPTRLTPRQLQVVALIAQGLGNREIAERLGLPLGTVTSRIRSALGATGVGERAGLVAVACRAGQLQDVPRTLVGPVVLAEPFALVLAGIAEGLPNKAIAKRSYTPLETVKWRVRRILLVLGARDRAHAVLIAWQLRILPDAPTPQMPAARHGDASERPAAPSRPRAASPAPAARYGAPERFGAVRR